MRRRTGRWSGLRCGGGWSLWRQALLVKAQATTERQHLLIRELHHRVKNALATVQALVGAIVRSTNSAAEFYDAFSARIAALGRTHSLLTEDYWQTASIHEMLKNELIPSLVD